MKKCLKNKKIVSGIFIILLTLSFSINLFNTDIPNVSFLEFQSDSENLVYGKIYCDRVYKGSSKYQFGLIKYDNSALENILTVKNASQYKMSNYLSQVGLQGYIISFLVNSLHFPIMVVKLIISFVLAVVLYYISYFISKKYDNKLLGKIFYLTFLLSPWVVYFGKNMYWVSFTWFLPGLFGLMLSLNYDKKKVFVPLIFLTVFIKCLCGYEYLSVIMLFVIAFMIIDFFEEKNKNNRKKIFITVLIVGIACLLAFLCALLIHGYMRGNGNILEGIKEIYEKDVLRRTILSFDKNSYDGIMRESMAVGIIQVLKMYLYDWKTDLIIGISGKLFPIIVMVSTFLCIKNNYQKKLNAKRYLIMYIIFLITCISWFILGKSHSYIHTHMNYVLWYFGFVQICLYIIINEFMGYLKKRLESVGENDSKNKK